MGTFEHFFSDLVGNSAPFSQQRHMVSLSTVIADTDSERKADEFAFELIEDEEDSSRNFFCFSRQANDCDLSGCGCLKVYQNQITLLNSRTLEH